MTGPLSRDVALALHGRAVERFGGARGVRDAGLLDAALAQPWQTFGGVELYPTPEEKVARLCFEVVTQHPFVDGNKRAGALLLGVLLRGEGYAFGPDASDLLHVIMGVAAGSKGYRELLGFVQQETGET